MGGPGSGRRKGGGRTWKKTGVFHSRGSKVTMTKFRTKTGKLVTHYKTTK